MEKMEELRKEEGIEMEENWSQEEKQGPGDFCRLEFKKVEKEGVMKSESEWIEKRVVEEDKDVERG